MSTSKKILKTDIAKIQDALDKMEANEQCEVSPRDFVWAIYDQIKVAVEDKRQSFDAISKLIGGEGVATSSRALRTHYNAISRAKDEGDAEAKRPTRNQQAA